MRPCHWHEVPSIHRVIGHEVVPYRADWVIWSRNCSDSEAGRDIPDRDGAGSQVPLQETCLKEISQPKVRLTFCSAGAPPAGTFLTVNATPAPLKLIALPGVAVFLMTTAMIARE